MLKMPSASVANLALLTTASVVAAFPWAAARAYPVFPQQSAVAAGTNVSIKGSSNLSPLNQSLKQAFEQQYSGAQVTVAAAGTTAALADVASGKADLAAIGRPLNDAEKAQGLVAVPIGRDKIAIVVGQKNPFKKDLTIGQFAKLFRGEAKTWKAVGGANHTVRFVDRVSVDTRSAFPNYPIFQGKKLESGATAVKLQDESLAAVKSKLGANGVSFLPASLAAGQKDIRMLTINRVKPTDQQYPFSQPLFYVYKGDQPNAAVQAFLGFAGGPSGQGAIKQAGVNQAIDFNQQATAGRVAQAPAAVKADPAKAADSLGESTATKKVDGSDAQPADTAKPDGQAPAASLNAAADAQSPAPGTTAVEPSTADASAANNDATDNQGAANNDVGAATDDQGAAAPGRGIPPWLWWLLLPLGLLGLLLWLLPKDEEDDVTLRGDKDQLDDTASVPALDSQWEPDSVGTFDYNPNSTEFSEVVADAPNLPGSDNTGNFSGGAAIAAAGAAAGIGAVAWSRLQNAPDEQSAAASLADTSEAEWEFEGELAAANTDISSRIADFATDPSYVGGDDFDPSQDPADDSLEPIQTADSDGLPLAAAVVGVTGGAIEGVGASIEPVKSDAANVGDKTDETTAKSFGWFKSWFSKAETATGDSTQSATGVASQLQGSLATDNNQAVDDPASASRRIVMRPHNQREVLVRWEIDSVAQDKFRSQGGTQLVLRLYDVTDMDITSTDLPPIFQQFDMDVTAREQRVEISQSDRTYMTILGYLTRSGGFLEVSRSNSVQIPTT